MDDLEEPVEADAQSDVGREEKFEDQIIGRSPLTLSWSQLRTFTECRQKHKLTQTGRKNPLQDIRGYFHGTVCDLIMRNWLGQDDPQPGQMPTMVDEYFDKCETESREAGEGVVKWRDKQDRPKLIAFCKELVTKLEPILYEVALPYEYQPEMRFREAIRIPHLDGTPTLVYLIGGIDILTKDSSGAMRAYDLKATANDQYINSVLGQSVFYDVVMRIAWPQAPWQPLSQFGFIQPMCKRQVVYAKILPEHRVQLMTRVIGLAHSLWRREHEPKTSSVGCDYCNVKHACDKFKPIPGSVKRMALGSAPLHLIPLSQDSFGG